MQSGFEVRLALIEDAPAILSIYQQHVEFEDITLTSVIEWIESATPERPMWVAVCEEELVGWSSLEPYYGLKVLDQVAELSLYISRDWRRKGVGTFLINEIKRNARSLSLSSLVVNIFSGNAISIQFFVQQGFSRYGVIPNAVSMPSGVEDIVIMGLGLP